RGVWLRLRIGRAFHHAVIGLLAIGLEIGMPALGHERIKFVAGGARRMDVAIGDRGLDVDGYGRIGTELDVHGVVSSLSPGMIFSENRLPRFGIMPALLPAARRSRAGYRS